MIDNAEYVNLWKINRHAEGSEQEKWEQGVLPINCSADFNLLLDIWIKSAAKWIPFVDSLTEEELSSSFEYKDSSGKGMAINRLQALAHLVNHGTHHRGQISAAMVQQGLYCDQLDYLYSPFVDRKVL